MSEKKVQTLIQIGTQLVMPETLTKPLPSRDFRSAWKLEGSVISLDLELMKPIAREKVNAWRDAKIASPIEVDGVTYAAGEIDTSMVDRAVGLADKIEKNGGVFETEWSDVNGKGVPMNKAGIEALGIAIGVRTSAMHVAARRLKEQIDTATNVSQIEAVLKSLA